MLWLSDLLYGSVTAEFESRFGLQESVSRLSAATRRFAFLTLQQVAVGRISKDRVFLHRAVPFFRNTHARYFFGEFNERNGRIVLSGRFTTSRFIKAFETVWFGGVAAGTSIAAWQVWALGRGAWWSPLVGIAMLAFGVANLWFGKWLSRNDIPWLSKVIQEALSASVHRDLAVEPPPPRC